MQTTAGIAVPRGGTEAARLTQSEKAAIIVRFLLNEGAALQLDDLPEPLQQRLTRKLGTMTYVHRETLAAVVMEFATELEAVGLAFPRGVSEALQTLDGTIDPATAARLRKEAGLRAGDPWERIGALDEDRICDLVQAESTEIAAVILSKISVSKAAGVLGHLPGASARRITYAMSLTEGISPDAVDRIGTTLVTILDETPEPAFQEPVENRLGAILNLSSEATRSALLTDLEADAPEFAENVRKVIFTFADIPSRLPPLEVPNVLRETDPTELITAIAAATGEPQTGVIDFLLSNTSARMADQLREDATELGSVSTKRGEAAMGAIVAAIRELETNGTLTLIKPDDE
jgi:flagellar motor switch protein FliG